MEDQPSLRTKQIQAMVGFKKSKMKDEKHHRGVSHKQFRNLVETVKLLMEILDTVLTKHPRRILPQDNCFRRLNTYAELLISDYLVQAAIAIFNFIKIFYFFSLFHIKLIPKHFHYFLSQIFLPIVFLNIRNFSIQKNLSISA